MRRLIEWALNRCAATGWLGEHESHLEFGVAEIYLRCLGCGRRTDGWHLDRPAPVVVRPEVRVRPVQVVRPTVVPHPSFDMLAAFLEADEQPQSRVH